MGTSKSLCYLHLIYISFIDISIYSKVLEYTLIPIKLNTADGIAEKKENQHIFHFMRLKFICIKTW